MVTTRMKNPYYPNIPEQPKVRLTAYLMLVLLATGCTTTLTKAIEEDGFQRIAAPRASIAPGAVVTTDDLPHGVVGVRAVCWREQAFPGLTPAIESRTHTKLIRKVEGTTFQLEAEYIDIIKGDAKYSRVKRIALDLSNALILEQSDADFAKAIDGRMQPCIESIGKRASRGHKMFTVTQVLRADVTFKVESSSEIGGSVGLSKELLDGLALKLGATRSDEGSQTVSGDGLHLGVFLDDLLFVEQPGAVEPLVRVQRSMGSNQRRNLQREPGVLLIDADAQ